MSLFETLLIAATAVGSIVAAINTVMVIMTYTHIQTLRIQVDGPLVKLADAVKALALVAASKEEKK